MVLQSWWPPAVVRAFAGCLLILASSQVVTRLAFVPFSTHPGSLGHDGQLFSPRAQGTLMADAQRAYAGRNVAGHQTAGAMDAHLATAAAAALCAFAFGAISGATRQPQVKRTAPSLVAMQAHPGRGRPGQHGAQRHKAMRRWEQFGRVPAWNRRPLIRKTLKKPWMMKHPGRKELSTYGRDIVECNRLRFHYGINNKQMTRLMIKSMSKGIEWPVDYLMQMLEGSLDMFCFRVKLGNSIHQARQFVRHGHLAVNGIIQTFPKFRLRPGDKVKVVNRESSQELAKRMLVQEKGKIVPKHVEFNEETLEGTYHDVCDPQDFGLKTEFMYITFWHTKNRRIHRTFYPGTRWRIRKREHAGAVRLTPENMEAARIGRGTHRKGRRRLAVTKKYWAHTKFPSLP